MPRSSEFEKGDNKHTCSNHFSPTGPSPSDLSSRWARRECFLWYFLECHEEDCGSVGVSDISSEVGSSGMKLVSISTGTSSSSVSSTGITTSSSAKANAATKAAKKSATRIFPGTTVSKINYCLQYFQKLKQVFFLDSTSVSVSDVCFRVCVS